VPKNLKKVIDLTPKNDLHKEYLLKKIKEDNEIANNNNN